MTAVRCPWYVAGPLFGLPIDYAGVKVHA